MNQGLINVKDFRISPKFVKGRKEEEEEEEGQEKNSLRIILKKMEMKRKKRRQGLFTMEDRNFENVDQVKELLAPLCFD